MLSALHVGELCCEVPHDLWRVGHGALQTWDSTQKWASARKAQNCSCQLVAGTCAGAEAFAEKTINVTARLNPQQNRRRQTCICSFDQAIVAALWQAVSHHQVWYIG